MGARTLAGQLTARALVASGAVLVLALGASVALTQRVLDDADSAAAMARARALVDTLEYETQQEGDTSDQSLDEVSSENKGERLSLRVGDRARGRASAVAPGACATELEGAHAWRSCAVARGPVAVTASVSVDAHRAAVLNLVKASAAIVAIAIALLIFAVRRALRGPIGEIRALVEWTGDIEETHAPPPRTDARELAQLGLAFDALVVRLTEAIARERTVTAHIAHELRTPLTLLLAELEKIPEAERARADARRVADVVQAILVLSEPRSERARAIVNVADVARELAPKDATVDAPDEALVEGDEQLIALAVQNLVENARKYAGEARSLTVTRERATINSERVRISVVDEGPGVPDEARAKMFDRYWRGVADGDGSGLGLALVRAIAERHGGSAEAAPNPGKRGLCVSMTLAPLVGWHDAR